MGHRMTSFYVMNRTGKFEPDYYDDNQCKAKGHLEYHYHIKLVFEGACKLNDDGFIIDHQEIDDVIQNLGLQGSCEEMHLDIRKKLIPALTEHFGLPLLACKCVIHPTKTPGAAWLEYVSLKDKASLPLLALLS